MRMIMGVVLGLGLVLSPIVWGEAHDSAKKQPGRPGLEPLAQELLGENWEQCDVQQLVELVMMVRLSQELDLSEERTVVMVRRFQELKERQKEANAKRQQAVKELKESIKTQANDETIQEKLNTLMALDDEVVSTRKKAFEEVSADLTTVQRAKLYVFLQDFEGQMRRLVEKARQRRAMDKEGKAAQSEGAPGKLGKDEGQKGGDQAQKKEEPVKEETAPDTVPPKEPQAEQKQENAPESEPRAEGQVKP